MRKEQKFDWQRRYYKGIWEGIKKIQKFIRQHPEVEKFSLDESCGKLYIKGNSLIDLHLIRMTLKKRINWGDRISHKLAFDDGLAVYYKGLGAYDFIEIKITFPYYDLPEGILGDCHIETKTEDRPAYVSTSRSIVCPMGGE